MEKSLANLASCPSKPTIPTPMWAARIMPTSLAPSPMPSVILPFSCRRTQSTISDFCLGLRRHPTTDLAILVRLINLVSSSGASAKCSVAPSMTRPYFFSPSVSTASAVQRPKARSICADVPGTSCSLIITISMSSSNVPLDRPILIAVSCLSPVKIQIAIPAWRRDRSVSGTPSCSLSSIAVTPTNVKARSISSATTSTSLSRSVKDPRASAYRLLHWSNHASSTWRYANASVRSPSTANAPMSSFALLSD
mmetsp:Transcript_16130/g.32629  ORF Transcript_16130/g.32629 Transcript_16130/m.32629 type:complete len:252 (-) Transcript_16130:1974-2729(-)